MEIKVTNLANVFDAINHGTYDRQALREIAEGKRDSGTGNTVNFIISDKEEENHED